MASLGGISPILVNPYEMMALCPRDHDLRQMKTFRFAVAVRPLGMAIGTTLVAVVASIAEDEQPPQAAVSESRSAPAEVVTWIQQEAAPLLSVQADHGLNDIEPLRAMIGDARVVGLGEATHGTREFFQLKHRIYEFLASELGFTVFAIEAKMPECEAVNAYVLEGAGQPIEALRGLTFWTWYTEELLDLVEWMRDWNLDPRHTKKLKFYGIDMQGRSAPVRQLLAFLEVTDPEFAEEVRSPLEAIVAAKDLASGHAGYDGEALKAVVEQVSDTLDERGVAYEQMAGRRALLWARQYTTVLRQNMRMSLLPEDDLAGRIGVRDAAMADNLRWILDTAEPGARVAVWAHNGHISKQQTWVQWMGHHLEAVYGDAYVPIGFAFQRGAFQAIDGNTEERVPVEISVGAAPRGSIGDTFQRAGWPVFLLDLRGLPQRGPAADWFNSPQWMRSADALFFSAERMLYERTLPDQFEVMAFVESTTRARPLAPPSDDTNGAGESF